MSELTHRRGKIQGAPAPEVVVAAVGGMAVATVQVRAAAVVTV